MPQFWHGKVGEYSKSTGLRDVTKATGVGKEMVPHHTPASPAVQHTSTEEFCVPICAQNWLIFIVQPLSSFPSVFLPTHFASTILTPQTLGCPSVAFQSSWAELGLLGTCCSSVLRFPCTRMPEFLLKDGKLAFSQHRSKGTSLTQALESWFPLICMSCKSPFLSSRRRDQSLPSRGSFVWFNSPINQQLNANTQH